MATITNIILKFESMIKKPIIVKYVLVAVVTFSNTAFTRTIYQKYSAAFTRSIYQKLIFITFKRIFTKIIFWHI